MEPFRIRTQLLHVGQNRNLSFSLHAVQHLQSGLHGHRAGIVAVVNDSDAAPFKYLLASLVALKLSQGQCRLLHGKPVCIRHCQGRHGIAHHVASHNLKAHPDPAVTVNRREHGIPLFQVQVLCPVVTLPAQSVQHLLPAPLRNH